MTKEELATLIFYADEETEYIPLYQCEEIAENLINDGVVFQKWISVAEEKPKKMDEYIVVIEGATSAGALYYSPMLDLWVENEEELRNREGYNVTHWMYMPELPRGE